MNKEFADATAAELEHWPGTSMRHEASGKHETIRLFYKHQTRGVIIASTASDSRALPNHIAQVRRALREMGANRLKPRKAARKRERNKPVREIVVAEKAPAKPDPFEVLAKANVCDAKPNQNQRLLNYLKDRRSIDPMTAWTKLGIYRLGARVYDLRQRGHPIKSDRVEVENRFGEPVKVARYTLEAA